MRATLIPFPDSHPGPIDRIEVEVGRVGEDALSLTYRAFGDLERVSLPEIVEGLPDRADELWKHTCFEAFLQPVGELGYLEFNFAPSMQWAAYRFDGYRQGMRPANVPPWSVSGFLPSKALELSVNVEPGRFARPDLPAPAWRLGLAAVIEDVDRSRTYWALAHPSDKPDFHHPDSFILDLP